MALASSWKTLVAAANGEHIVELTLSSLTSGAAEAVSHHGPTGCAPISVSCTMTTAPTDGSVVSFTHTASSTSADTITVKFTTPPGGSMDGAVAKVLVRFLDAASGGQSTITTT